MFKSKDKYKYRGSIDAYGGGSDIVEISGDIGDEKPPVLLRVSKALLKYIKEIGGTDAEERYLLSDYCYGNMLTVTRIEVPGDKEGIPAKIITCEEIWSEDVVIFGEQEYIETQKPKSMSWEEYDRWREWEREHTK